MAARFKDQKGRMIPDQTGMPWSVKVKKTFNKDGTYMTKESFWKLVSLSGVPFIMVLGNSMLIPVFPEMQRAMSINQFQAGLTITFFSLPAGIAIPIMGFLADKIGRKKIIVPSLIIYGLGGIISGLSPIIFNKSYAILLAGRVIQGIGAAGTAPIAMALVSDIFTSAERSKAQGTLESANGLGKVISPVLGAAIALIIWYALFFVYAFLAIPIAVAIWLVIQEPDLQTKDQSLSSYVGKIKSIFQTKGTSLMGSYAAGSTVLLVLFGIMSYLSDVLETDFGLKGIIKGLALAVPVLAMSVTAFFSGKYLEKKQEQMKYFILVGLLLVAISLASMSIFKVNSVFLTAVVSTGIGTGLVLPAVNTLVTSSCRLEERGGITALYGGVRFLGVAAGPPSFSFLLGYGKTVMFSFGAILPALAFILSLWLIGGQEILQEGKSQQEGKTSSPVQTPGESLATSRDPIYLKEFIIALFRVKRKNQ